MDGKTSTAVGGELRKGDHKYLTDEELETRIVKLRKEKKMRLRQVERSLEKENMWKTGVVQGGPSKKLKLDEIQKKRGRWRRTDHIGVPKNKKRKLAQDEVVCDKIVTPSKVATAKPSQPKVILIVK